MDKKVFEIIIRITEINFKSRETEILTVEEIIDRARFLNKPSVFRHMSWVIEDAVHHVVLASNCDGAVWFDEDIIDAFK